MVLLSQRERMTEFIAARLEESQLYRVLERDAFHLLVQECSETGEDQKAIYVFAHGVKTPVDDVRRRETYNEEHGIFSAHVFYRDGKTFFVPLGTEAINRRSLERGDREQRSAMIHLRGLERAVLASLPASFQQLTTYQPPTETSVESLQLHEMIPAAGQPGRNYRLPCNISTITHAAYFRLVDDGGSRQAIIRPYEAVVRLPTVDAGRGVVNIELAVAAGRR